MDRRRPDERYRVGAPAQLGQDRGILVGRIGDIHGVGGNRPDRRTPLHEDTDAVAAGCPSIRLKVHDAERVNRYGIGHDDHLPNVEVRSGSLALFEMTCRKQDAEDEQHTTHRSLPAAANKRAANST